MEFDFERTNEKMKKKNWMTESEKNTLMIKKIYQNGLSEKNFTF